MTDRAGVYVETPLIGGVGRSSRQDVTSYVRDWIIEELHRQDSSYGHSIREHSVPVDAVPWLVEQLVRARTERGAHGAALEHALRKLVKLEHKAAKRKRRKAKRKARTMAARGRTPDGEPQDCHWHDIPGAYAPDGTGRKP